MDSMRPSKSQVTQNDNYVCPHAALTPEQSTLDRRYGRDMAEEIANNTIIEPIHSTAIWQTLFISTKALHKTNTNSSHNENTGMYM